MLSYEIVVGTNSRNHCGVYGEVYLMSPAPKRTKGLFKFSKFHYDIQLTHYNNPLSMSCIRVKLKSILFQRSQQAIKRDAPPETHLISCSHIYIWISGYKHCIAKTIQIHHFLCELFFLGDTHPHLIQMINSPEYGFN